MPAFEVVSDFSPAGDQGSAIAALSNGLQAGHRYQTLKGVTGSGKTYSMAKVIEAAQVPTLVMSHNKTLAAQLYREFKDFLPHNAVEYFVSYYDYYQPEAYVASRDLYIEKDASINEEIERLRLGATTSLMERRDVVVVATVSCIYGLGSPEDYRDMRVELQLGMEIEPRRLMRRLVSLQYTRNDALLMRAGFRSRGEVLELLPPHAKEGLRIEFFGDEIERLRRIDPLTGDTLAELEFAAVYPAKHFVTPEERVERAVEAIRAELAERHEQLLAQGKLVEAQRLMTRCEYDLEMLAEIGYCSGVENYSRHLSGRQAGERPAVLLDFFPQDFLVFIDESHVSVPQIGAMYEGDRSRKQALVDHGFRLPSALDNRPLTFGEFESLMEHVVYVSATPAQEELRTSAQVVEQIIRPTGLLDPQIEVRNSAGQIEDLYRQIRERTGRGERTLVTTLTKRMAEDLSDYLADIGVRCRFLHSEVDTFERVEILRDLRAGEFDVLVGVNLLREGLDLPEVSLIAILDADKIGFLRSTTSLIQIIGRAARNVNGLVVMYADRESESMREAIAETARRRKIQLAYNTEHGITPTTIIKAVQDLLVRKTDEKVSAEKLDIEVVKQRFNVLVPKERRALIRTLEKEMLELAKDLEYERAAVVRDEIEKLRELDNAQPAGAPAAAR
ncbi:MAG: excinuclease ABC subunit UvrB [Spirochaetaceae bacterium]|nr:excinuclease ABC subunit UvrB [Spirochaetaceae bacterium]